MKRQGADVSMRLPRALLERIDAARAAAEAATMVPVPVSRSAVIREALTKGLDVLERERRAASAA